MYGRNIVRRARFVAVAAGLLAGAAGMAAADVPPEVVNSLCAGRAPCTVASTQPAGRDKQGTALTVVELNLGAANPGNENFPCRPYRREYWVVGGAQPEAVLKLCNDGYGAAGVGEDNIKVMPRGLIHTREGGSNWRWRTVTDYALSPIRARKVDECGYHTASSASGVATWDYRSFRGMSGMNCGGSEESEMGVCDMKQMQHRWIEIPQIAGSGLEGRDSAPVLGTCATRLDGSGTSGFVLLGNRSADTPEVRILMVSDTEMLITVFDDAFVAGTRSWVHDDHLEIWHGAPWNYFSCSDDDPSAKLVQWGIRTADGKVFNGFGKPAQQPRILGHSIGEVDGMKAASFRVVLPARMGGVEANYRNLAVSYSKSNGKKQTLLFATSPIKFGDGKSLGDTRKIGKRVQCEVRGGKLDVVDAGLIVKEEE